MRDHPAMLLARHLVLSRVHMVNTQGIPAIQHIPCIAVQGRLDLVCPVKTAYDLHCAWPQMELRVVPGAGHSMYDPAITHELLEATDRMRALQPLRPAPARPAANGGSASGTTALAAGSGDGSGAGSAPVGGGSAAGGGRKLAST